jgi:hypothetical protein
MTTASEQVDRDTRQPLPPAPGLRERIRGWLRRDDALDPTFPLTTAQVLQEEAKAIHGVDPGSLHGEPLYRFLNRLDQSALCLSGGGIRSAAFALGVIQALAAHPRTQNGDPVDTAEDSLLAKFHYLSTVSGGGYVGSWLSAWRARAPFETLWRNLVGRPDGPDSEPPTIGWLRSYSNYLTPQLGLLSADTWAIVAVYVRNLLVNWVVILPVLCASILALKFAVVALTGLSRINFAVQPRFLIVAIGVAFLLVSLSYTTRNRPSRRGEGTEPPTAGDDDADQTFLRGSLIWTLLAAVAFTQYLGVFDAGPAPLPPSMARVVGIGALIAAATYAAGWIIGRPRNRDVLDFLIWTLSGVVFGALVAVGFYLYVHIPSTSEITEDSIVVALANNPIVYLIVGVPWILAAQWVADMVFVALSSYRQEFNADQEWLGRAAGWLLLTAVGWILGMLVTFAGFLTAINSKSALNFYSIMTYWIVPVTGLAALVIALVGTSSLSRFNFGIKGTISLIVDTAITIAAPLFVGALIFALSTALDLLLLGRHLFDPQFQLMIRDLASAPPKFDSWLATLEPIFLGCLGSLVLAVFVSRCVNINRFSLHALYRNRLIRAFLGASRKRKPDPFTGFDGGDDPLMHELWPKPEAGAARREAGGWRPFHIINLTLNIVSSNRLAWQERKAAPFTVSALHCGTSSRSYSTAKESGNTGEQRDGAYRPSTKYGSPQGISLGTAMAISGAAANPNMGYHSSPSVAFLMTMFNLRLGWWLGNPGPEGARTYSHSGPAVAILPLVQETLGLTTDDRQYVHVSDGGHFENLGLYEMVRRRCRFIVISDAGRDPAFAFEDLGNAVRKILIDLGVPIRFHKLEALKCRPVDGSDIGMDCDYHAIAEIDYQNADSSTDVANGLILYVKAGYHGTEGADIKSYAMANLDFPHQSTMNQWFSESQFESYRSLGFRIMDGILTRASCDPAYAKAPGLETLLAALKAGTVAPGRNLGETPTPEDDRPRERSLSH